MSASTASLAQLLRAQLTPPLLVLRDFAAQIANILPDTWDRFRFRRFWGEDFLDTNIYFVADTYENVRLRDSFRSAESISGTPESMVPEIIAGSFCPQAAAILTTLFLRYSGKPVRITSDTDPMPKDDAVIICYGPPDTNFRTFEAEASAENGLCRFVADADGQRAFRLAGRVHAPESRSGVLYDKAVVLRLRNRQFPGHAQVICAGLSEWGSLAAVCYLARNWKELHKRFDSFGPRRDFCVLLEVPYGQFEKARELISVVSWEPAKESRRILASNHV